MPDINGFELLELLRSSNVGNSPTIPVVVATASGSCNKGELLAKGFAGCLFKPFSISELMEVSDRCAIKATPDGKPDFSALLSYGNEAVMLEKLITETEKEMQAVRDAAKEKDLQKLFGNIVYRAEFHAFHGGINFGVVGHNDEGLHLSLLSHPAQKVYATAVRQTQVGNHDIIICCLLQMFLRG
jgi:CheY-like chemotaxis protein